MAHFYSRLTFLIGLLLGVLIAVYIKRYHHHHHIPQGKGLQHDLYEKWFRNRSLVRRHILWDQLRYANQTFNIESEYLFKNIRLLCIILIKSSNNLRAAKDTWAKGCNKIVHVMLESRSKIMPTKQRKENSSWVLLCTILNRIDIVMFEWVLIVKDTSFVITENFRHYVAPLNPEKSHYLGHAVKFWSTIYNSADPGYALSAGSVRTFQKYMGNGKCMENSYWNKEDFYLGKYLAKLNITPVNTVDDNGFSTFYPYNWFHVFYPGYNYYQNSVFPVKCCSKWSIAFQAVEGDKMYTFNYLFYNLQIFTTGHYGNYPFKDEIPEDKPWKQFLRQQNISRVNVTSEEYYKLWENLINDPNSFAQNLKKEQIFDYD